MRCGRVHDGSRVARLVTAGREGPERLSDERISAQHQIAFGDGVVQIGVSLLVGAEARAQGLAVGVYHVDRLDLKLMALVVRARVHVDDLVLLGVVAISELREVGEDSAVAHVVAVDHDEGRVERALAVDEGRAVSALP